ncbi:MAG: hypothetical protein IJP01_04905 [Oscillospiraceae bacterium]|nr:hypothetical protein [Oscillospiraceae bacterium]
MKGKEGKDYKVVPRKGFEKIAAALRWILLPVCSLAIVCLILMFFEVVDGTWRETTFSFSHYKYFRVRKHVSRYRSRVDLCLDIYATDGRRFTTTHEEIGYLLVEGREYYAVYSTFDGELKGLVDDAGHVFINADKLRQARKERHIVFTVPIILSIVLLILLKCISKTVPIPQEEKTKLKYKYLE